MRITLRQLQIFIAIAQSGSTTAAAEVIALSQSAISASIAELEKALNVQLFDRIGKRLMLNDHGRAMLPQALVLMDNATILELSFTKNPPSQLKIGASFTIGNYLLPELLAHFWQSQGVEIAYKIPATEVTVANTGEIIEKLVNFEVDIGLIEGVCHRSELQVTSWIEDELLLVVSPKHPLAQKMNNQIVELNALHAENWLLREVGSGTREALEHALLPHIRQLKSSIQFNDHEAIKQAAVAGLGIACLSKFMVKDTLATNKLMVVRTNIGTIKRKFSILTHHQKQITVGMQGFINNLTLNNS